MSIKKIGRISPWVPSCPSIASYADSPILWASWDSNPDKDIHVYLKLKDFTAILVSITIPSL